MSIEGAAKAAFLEVVDVPVERRGEALSRVCGGDEEVLRRVEELLRSHRSTAGHPERIGGYIVERVIDRGGMGVVYEARQAHPNRKVAIKVLRWWAGEGELRRFELEAEALGRLHHPGIAQVYEAGRAVVARGDGPGEEAPFIAMELIPAARNIVEYARNGGLDLGARIELMMRVCEAVQAAHEHGIIHRDLKPDNILVGPDGAPRVIDFGVARIVGAGATLHTSAGQVIGTPGYMSPEQCAGDARDAGVRSDVYSLGAILYELATGTRVHRAKGGALAEVIRRVQETDVEWPAGRGRAWRSIGAVSLKCLSREPERRYGSAGELGAELRRVLEGDRVEAQSPGVFDRARRWAWKHPIATTAAACVAIVVLAICGAAVGIYTIALRPDHLLLDDQRRFVSLQSRAGHRLHVWEPDPGGRVVFDRLLARPRSLGGGRIILVGLQPNLTSARRPGRIEAFLTGDLGKPIWTTDSWPIEPPPEYAERTNAIQAIDMAILEDVFAESPGPELIVVHSLHPFSPAAIRIYDLGGGLRYEGWHDGAVSSLKWLSGAKRLLICGLNSEARWDERGVEGLRPCFPFFVAAIEPRSGRVGYRGWLTGKGQGTADPTLKWYKWIGPVEHLKTMQDSAICFVGPGLGWDADRSATMVLWKPADTTRELCVVLDEDGREHMRWTNDGYKTAERIGEVPRAEAFELLSYEELPRAKGGERVGRDPVSGGSR